MTLRPAMRACSKAGQRIANLQVSVDPFALPYSALHCSTSYCSALPCCFALSPTLRNFAMSCRALCYSTLHYCTLHHSDPPLFGLGSG